MCIDRFAQKIWNKKWLLWVQNVAYHYDDVIINAMGSQITSLAIVYSTVYSGADQRKRQSSASLCKNDDLFTNMDQPSSQPSKVWDEITSLFPNFNGSTVEVWDWTSNFIPYIIGCNYLSTLGLKLNHVSKGGLWSRYYCSQKRITHFYKIWSMSSHHPCAMGPPMDILFSVSQVKCERPQPIREDIAFELTPNSQRNICHPWHNGVHIPPVSGHPGNWLFYIS